MLRKTVHAAHVGTQILLIGCLRVYRVAVSPWLGQRCRFHPSCSHYAEDALKRHGVFRGIGLTAWRLLRCHPWHPGGIDPVPHSLPPRD